MILYGMDGTKTVLWESSVKPFPEYPNQTYYPYTLAAGTQSDGRLLTVALSEGKLHWWMDGRDKKEIAVPADICSEKVVRNGHYQFLTVGENGFILIANYADEEEMQIRNFAAYDIGKDTWYRFATDRDVTKGAGGVAKEHSWFVLNDETNNVYIYDMETDKLLYQLPLQLPQNSVEEIGLVLGDAYLAVKTGDSQVFIYDITTGDIVYNAQLDNNSGGSVHVEEDKENRRVYIWDDASHRDAGVCVDKDSWTELAQIPGLLYYDSLRNKLYCYRNYGEDGGREERVIVCTPPALEELVEMGEELLNK